MLILLAQKARRSSTLRYASLRKVKRWFRETTTNLHPPLNKESELSGDQEDQLSGDREGQLIDGFLFALLGKVYLLVATHFWPTKQQTQTRNQSPMLKITQPPSTPHKWSRLLSARITWWHVWRKKASALSGRNWLHNFGQKPFNYELLLDN